VISSADVAVVGGGAIGCSIAYHAAGRGAKVVLLEAERLGSGSSGALAGMLSGQAETEKSEPMRDLMIRGREYHKELAQDLYETTSLDPGYVWDGALRTARDGASEMRLREEHSWNESAGLAFEWLSGDEARELEPELSPNVTAGLYLPDDGQVNPPQLLNALAIGAAIRGAELMEATRVIGFVTEDQRVTGLRTTRGRISTGTVVVACGAFSNVLSEQLGIELPVYPLKGEMLVTNMWPSPIRANVWDSANFYVVPKKDGRVIIGATEEPNVHDRSPTLGGVADLSRAAVDLIPTLSGAAFVSTWGGLRPATPSGLPVLGPAGGWEGLLLATGHFRNGVLLSAITGQIIGALALGEASPVEISPFLHERLEEGEGLAGPAGQRSDRRLEDAVPPERMQGASPQA
jgi:glycine oxidase